MCNKTHATTEEAIACRNAERQSELIAALQKGNSHELLLHDALTLFERATREHNPQMMMDEEFWQLVRMRIGR